MHAYRALIETHMNDRGMTPADLMRASGISKQVLSGILNDTRDKLDRLPLDKTVDGLAKAFNIPRERILLAVGQAMGLPVQEPVVINDPTGASDDDILRVLSERLRARKEGEGRGERPAATSEADETSAEVIDLTQRRPPVRKAARRGVKKKDDDPGKD